MASLLTPFGPQEIIEDGTRQGLFAGPLPMYRGEFIADMSDPTFEALALVEGRASPLMEAIAKACASFERRHWRESQRLWSEIVKNYTMHEDFVAYCKLFENVSHRLCDVESQKEYVETYRASRSRSTSDRQIAIYSVITGNYDSVKLPAKLDDRFDYILFADSALSGGGVWDVRPLPWSTHTPAKASRYVKMHPHELLSNYDIAIYADANLMIVGDLYPLLETFLASDEGVGSTRHPTRDSIFDEVLRCIELKKDAPEVMLAQVERYRREGFVHDDLVEAGLLMFKLSDHKVHSFLGRWWSELEHGSRRDQLSFNYALAKSGNGWHRLMDRPLSLRNHPALINCPHDFGEGPAKTLIDALADRGKVDLDCPSRAA